MTFLLGLTGSIGMGKSTTARMFAEQGCAVWDADAAVHRLYGVGGDAVAPIASAFPTAVSGNAVDRNALKQIIVSDPKALKRIESIVHPLVREDRERFILENDADIFVLDIPLLFETGSNKDMDAVACVSVPREVQQQRVLARGSMSEAQLAHILSNQMPNDTKCSMADYVIVTDTLEHAEQQVRSIVAQIRKGFADA
jgi:dephospho-CoA kinase